MNLKKATLGTLVLVSTAIVGAAIVYPEDFAFALVGLIIGFAMGVSGATMLMESYFGKGANMAHELQKKQIINPATIMREARMAEASEAKQQTKNVQIPQFDLTGLQK